MEPLQRLRELNYQNFQSENESKVLEELIETNAQNQRAFLEALSAIVQTVDMKSGQTNATSNQAVIKKIDELIRTIKSQEVNVEAPIVNVPEQEAPQVNVEAPDLAPISEALEVLGETVKKNKPPTKVKTEQMNTLINEKFDEYKIRYDEFDEEDMKIEAVDYYYKGKKVATIKYSYTDDGELKGGKKV